MKEIPQEIKLKLSKALPSWAVRPNPMKPNMSVIHPMAIIERLNECFGIGGWNFKTREIEVTKEIQKTKTGERTVYMSAIHGTLIVPEYGIDTDQYGGSTNDDKGDSLKGGATDALTKIASYLGIGAEIYKGHGNVDALDGKVPTTPQNLPNKATPPKKELPFKQVVTNSILKCKNLEELEKVATGIKTTEKLTEIEKSALLSEIDIKAMDFEDIEVTPDTVPFNN